LEQEALMEYALNNYPFLGGVSMFA